MSDVNLMHFDRSDPSMQHATNGTLDITVLNGGKIFMRRAIRGFGSPKAEAINWLVCELNGVRVYIDGDKIVMSTQDLNP